MRPPVLIVALALAAGSVASNVARAEPAPAAKPVEVFSVINADEFSSHFVVAYPASCDPATGLAYGTPGAQGSADVIDYAVVQPGVETPAPRCKHSQLYVIAREGFKKFSRTGTQADRTGEGPFVAVPELEAMGPQGRAEFFEKDPRVTATRHRFGERGALAPGDRLRKIHDVLRLERDDMDFFMIGERVIYGYVDGTEEVAPFIAGRRPPPTGNSAPPEERRVRLSSDIPRWPWILGACVVFVGMALYGLRRRS